MWYPGDGQRIVRMAEAVAGDADSDPFSRWIAGVIFAAAVALFGLAHFAAAAGWPPLAWLFQLWHLRDVQVVAGVGLFWLAVAGFLHAHYFWTPSERWHVVGQVGKGLAGCVIVALLLTAVIGGFVGWFEVPRLWRRGWR
jgi:hypothetical protein